MAVDAAIEPLMLMAARGGTLGARKSASSRAAPRLRELVAGKLSEDWSPEQIAGWLKLEFGEDHTRRVSHETIYLSLFIQARGALKRELVTHLRRAGAVRRPRGARL